MTLLREPYSRLLSHWLFWRQHTVEELIPWGGWAEHVKKARLPLVKFLSDPQLAPQIDNLTVRMLLWPHPLLPLGGFIEPVNDAQLLDAARARLRQFSFSDIVENRGLPNRLQQWLGRSLHHNRLNETRPIPKEYCSPLHLDLTYEALDLLEMRSRLDVELWTDVARQSLPGQNICKLRHQALLANTARYGVLMAG